MPKFVAIEHLTLLVEGISLPRDVPHLRPTIHLYCSRRGQERKLPLEQHHVSISISSGLAVFGLLSDLMRPRVWY